MARKTTDVMEPSDLDFPGDDTGYAVAAPAPMQLGVIEGDDSDATLAGLPNLKIVHGVGKLAEFHNPGTWVLGGEYALAGKSEPLQVIIIGGHRYWKEYLPFSNEGPQPRIFATAQEVQEAGGTTEWVNGVGPTFSRAIELKMLIRKPKGLLCALFGIEIGEHEYAPAQWYVDKTAYRRINPTIQSAESFSLRKRGLSSGVFEIATKSDKVNGNVVVVPTIRLAGHLSDGELEELKGLFPTE